MNKVEFLKNLRDEQTQWEAFLNTIEVSRRELPGACGKWSVKDVIAHVSVWERFVTAAVRAHTRIGSQTAESIEATPQEKWGEFVPGSDLKDDALNEWTVEQVNHRSYGEILGMQREIRQQLYTVVETLSEHELTAPEVVVKGLPWKKDKPLWRIIASMSYTHINDHRDGMVEELNLR